VFLPSPPPKKVRLPPPTFVKPPPRRITMTSFDPPVSVVPSLKPGQAIFYFRRIIILRKPSGFSSRSPGLDRDGILLPVLGPRPGYLAARPEVSSVAELREWYRSAVLPLRAASPQAILRRGKQTLPHGRFSLAGGFFFFFFFFF